MISSFYMGGRGRAQQGKDACPQLQGWVTNMLQDMRGI